VRPSDPVAVQLAEDIGREHERRAIAKADKGDTDAIARRGIGKEISATAAADRAPSASSSPPRIANVMASLPRLEQQRAAELCRELPRCSLEEALRSRSHRTAGVALPLFAPRPELHDGGAHTTGFKTMDVRDVRVVQ
jgi:hypothetical protein